MDMLIALALLAAPAEYPALAGGPQSHAAHAPVQHPIADQKPATRLQAGDRITLDARFYASPLAGGVERGPALRVYRRSGLVIIDASPHRPISAAREAARRGLPRR